MGRKNRSTNTDTLLVSGISHDNGEIVSITVSGSKAEVVSKSSSVVDWQHRLSPPANGKLVALARDDSGNVEQTSHTRTIR